MKESETASKTCEKHGHSAMHHIIQINIAFLQFFKKIFPQTVYRYTGQLSPCYNLELGSYKDLRSLI